MRDRKTEIKTFRWDEVEKAIIISHLQVNNYNDIRDYLRSTIIQQYYDVAIANIEQLKKNRQMNLVKVQC